ncbi:MAG: hypothetical protein ABIV23_02385, partial [Sphingomicrobium sp.]
MEPHPLRSASPEAPREEVAMSAYAEPVIDEPGFDAARWEDKRAEHDGAGGRMVLGWALAMMAALWIGYTAWSAGRALGGVTLGSPAVAQWVAVVTGPLALMGLAWLMFGRTRRKEAEKFTHSVIAMRGEARSLEALLAVLATRIEESHQGLHAMSGQLMGLGEEAAQRLGTVTRELDSGSQRLVAHGTALDQAAAAARTDIGVLLADLPLAEARAVAMAELLRESGGEASRQAALYEQQISALLDRTRETDGVVGDAAGRLVTHLTHIESASAAAHARLDEASTAHRDEIDG